jgi:hypothetical protein
MPASFRSASFLSVKLLVFTRSGRAGVPPVNTCPDVTVGAMTYRWLQRLKVGGLRPPVRRIAPRGSNAKVGPGYG